MGGIVPQSDQSLIHSVFLELIFERSSWVTVGIVLSDQGQIED